MSASSSDPQSNELVDVAANVQRVFKPVTPPPAFREHLRDGLRMAAEHQLAHRALEFEYDRRNATAWGWVFGAALLGALVSFIIIQLRMRHAR